MAKGSKLPTHLLKCDQKAKEIVACLSRGAMGREDTAVLHVPEDSLYWNKSQDRERPS